MGPRRHTIRRMLIANRGEIARRIARTCHAMGIGTVAVFSDADAEAPHVRECDQAVRIGPAPSRSSYLAIDRLIEAARATGADAVHPGYGFLAENAAFAAACRDAGLVFVGPQPDVIAALGSKVRARELAARAGVPVVPSFPLEAAPAELEYPVLLKASAGGGGKGMRIVRAASEMAAAVESARREAAAAFGDDTLLVERYLEEARHVEIQILGDHHGDVVHLFERECSIQRRHQKIVEESPSPAVTPALREAMGRAALSLAREVGYQNAGTVELLLAADGSFYFLEVNTRLQVEHPVTELVTGLDLVREQIRVAEGAPLGMSQDDLAQDGHAIECRLYAEDPEQDFLPSGGRMVTWRPPELPGLRVDSGVEAGSEVPTHYDPMLAKVIVHARSREEAAGRLAGALERLLAQGVTTNRELLVAVLRHPEFLAGRLDTHFLERHAGELFGRAPEPGALARAAVAAALAGMLERRAGRTVLPEIESGWRMLGAGDTSVRFRWREQALEVGYRALGGGRFACRADGEAFAVRLAGGPPGSGEIALEDEAGVRRRFAVTRSGDSWHVSAGGRDFALAEEPRFTERRAATAEGGLSAPMPGRVVRVLVSEGDPCAPGQTLVILEAMKMEHAVKSARAGRVSKLLVREGDPVEAGAALVALEPLPGEADGVAR